MKRQAHRTLALAFSPTEMSSALISRGLPPFDRDTMRDSRTGALLELHVGFNNVGTTGHSSQTLYENFLQTDQITISRQSVV